MSAKNLVIVESPTKATTIQKFLGEDFVVMSSKGHIRDLQDHNLSIDTEHGFLPIYVIPDDKKKVVKDLKAMVSKVDTVWLASDEDREGEAISWHLTQALGLDPATTKRIVFHEITSGAISAAVQNPRLLDMNLVNAQQARRVLDRLVGFELSPVLWKKIQRNLSAGRVQSVALRLVVDREREILSFSRTPFYRVEGTFTAPSSSQPVRAVLDSRFSTLEEARTFLTDSIGAVYTVEGVDKKEAVRTPAPPFTTSTLQQEASRRLHLPVSQTMRIAQDLYERGLITYMRTDSTNLSSLAIGTARTFIVGNYGEQYHKARQYQTHSKGAQEAHEAIRPTYISSPKIQGTPQEQKLYELIWKRTVASQMADAKLLRTDVTISSDKRSELFKAQASEVLFDGFLKVYIESTEDGGAALEEGDVILPAISDGTVLQCSRLGADCKFTQAPQRYSEATIIKKLEELGIGRPSTYSPIITTLTRDRGYIQKGNVDGEKVTVTNLVLQGGKVSSSTRTETVGADKGKLLPQNIGMAVTDYLVKYFPDIMNYDFTANVEKDFDLVAGGEKQWDVLIREFYGPFHEKVEEVLSAGDYGTVTREIGTDPRDGLVITAHLGQYGPYLQKGEGDGKVYANLPSDVLMEAVTLEDALKVFSLPRTIGEVEGVPLTANVGRYGPYVKYGDRNASIPKGSDPFSITLADALKLFVLPRTVGQYEGNDVVVNSGRFGPYVKCGDVNRSLPKGSDPGAVTLEQCIQLIQSASSKEPAVIRDFPELEAKVLSGRFGPYIRHTSGNYKIPAGTDAQALTAEDVKAILSSTSPTGRSARKASAKAKSKDEANPSPRKKSSAAKK